MRSPVALASPSAPSAPANDRRPRRASRLGSPSGPFSAPSHPGQGRGELRAALVEPRGGLAMALRRGVEVVALALSLVLATAQLAALVLELGALSVETGESIDGLTEGADRVEPGARCVGMERAKRDEQGLGDVAGQRFGERRDGVCAVRQVAAVE